MPRWDFICSNCGGLTERAFRDVETAREAYVRCDHCGNHPTVRVASAPNFAVKGFSAANGYAKKG